MCQLSFTQLLNALLCGWWGTFWVPRLVEMWPGLLFQYEFKISSRYNELWGGKSPATYPSPREKRNIKKTSAVDIWELSQLTLSVLCYHLVRLNGLEPPFKCVEFNRYLYSGTWAEKAFLTKNQTLLSPWWSSDLWRTWTSSDSLHYLWNVNYRHSAAGWQWQSASYWWPPSALTQRYLATSKHGG